MVDTEKILSRADEYELKREVERARLLEEKARQDSRKVSRDHLEKFSLAELEARKGTNNAKRLIGRLEKDAILIRQAVTFVNPVLSAIAPLCPGAITLIGASSGTGKSTTAAAIANSLYSEKRKTFVISNEETEARVLARVACAELGIDFNLYIQDKLPREVRKQVAAEIQKIEPYVTVADDPIASTTVESIQRLLQEIDKSGAYACVVVDFLQRIIKSTAIPSAERTQVLYNFKDMITDYAQHAKTPVVVMTQLIPLPSDEVERNVETRIKWVRGFYEAAATVIEVIKIKGLPVSTFYVAKGRFTQADVSVSCRYDSGKFSYLSKSELQKLKDSLALEKLDSLIKDIGVVDVDAP
jgi:replicative DNA helicase